MSARIRSDQDLAIALDALVAADPRLDAAARRAPRLPLRLHPPGLEGLLRIVVGQQLSTQSAAAVWSKVEARYAPFDARALAAADEMALRKAGLSRQKARTFHAVAAAVCDGLDLEALALADPGEARAALEAISGIGRWSADLYLMFCAGHPDILPVGDLAVRRGAQAALGLAEPFTPMSLDLEGAVWSPYRSTAARLFYTIYRLDRTPSAVRAQKASPAADAGMPL